MNGVIRALGDKFRRLPGAIWYLAVGGVTSFVSLFALIGLLLVAAFCLIGVGIPALPEAFRVVRPLLSFERRRAAQYLGAPIVESYEPFTGGLRQRVTTVFTDPANRRDFAWLAAHGTTGLFIGTFAIGIPLGALNQLLIPAYWQAAPEGDVITFGFLVDSWPLAALSFLLAFPLIAVTLRLPAVARWQASAARYLLGPAEGAVL
ncbi:sensor domain-containing protein, partial [Nocardia altamirensis]|uniref:sensor domain-containing protein n=1 Tax=Nocardia altamirensis TaxID=472158 RepID=UPI00157BE341